MIKRHMVSNSNIYTFFSFTEGIKVMTKRYIVSPNHKNYYVVYEDGSTIRTHVGSDLGSILYSGGNEVENIRRCLKDNPEYYILNDEQFKEWESVGLVLRELISDTDSSSDKTVSISIIKNR